MVTVPTLLERAIAAAVDAGKVIMDIYQGTAPGYALKHGGTPITEADTASHRVIVDHLTRTGLPILSEEGRDIPYAEREKWDMFWLVDPLDGTKEFLRHNGEFTINIALVRKGLPLAGVVYLPSGDQLFYGSMEVGVYKVLKGKSTRLQPLPARKTLEEILQKEKLNIAASRSHFSRETADFLAPLKNYQLIRMGSAMKFMLVLEGKADLYPRMGPTMEWDTAAAHAILNASNRGVYQLDRASELVYNKPGLGNPGFIAY